MYSFHKGNFRSEIFFRKQLLWKIWQNFQENFLKGFFSWNYRIYLVQLFFRTPEYCCFCIFYEYVIEFEDDVDLPSETFLLKNHRYNHSVLPYFRGNQVFSSKLKVGGAYFWEPGGMKSIGSLGVLSFELGELTFT